MALGSQRRVVTDPIPEGGIPEPTSPLPCPTKEIGQMTIAPRQRKKRRSRREAKEDATTFVPLTDMAIPEEGEIPIADEPVPRAYTFPA